MSVVEALGSNGAALTRIVAPAAALTLLASTGPTRRISVSLILLGLRWATPVACVLVLRDIARFLQRHRTGRLLRFIRIAMSAWAAAEVGFFFYFLQNRRRLNCQTTTRWRAVTTHSTQEKRKSSLERYLLALTKVCKVANNDDASAESGPTATKSEFGVGLRKLKRTGSMGFGSGSSLLGRCNFAAQSTENLLSLHDCDENLPDNEVQRLKVVELGCWFTGPGCGDPEDLMSWLQRGNLEDWIAHYWFRGATAEELRGSSRDMEDLKALVDYVLKHVGLTGLREGRNPRIRPHRWATDSLPAQHRPLMLYGMTSVLCPLMSNQVMKYLGFRREQVGGLTYWKRVKVPRVRSDVDIAVGVGRGVPLVFVHGLGVGLVPYYLFIHRLSQHFSGDFYVPEFPFLAMAPWENIPSAREIVAQLQDMLIANRHTSAHFMGHSFGCVVINWMLRFSPSSVVCTTLMEPAIFLMIKSDALTKVLYGPPITCYQMCLRYLVFRELFTLNLLCRNFFWEQSSMWPEDLHVPAVFQLAGDDHIVQSFFVMRLLEHEQNSRKQKRRTKKSSKRGGVFSTGSSVDIRSDSLQTSLQATKDAEAMEIQWCEGFFHGEILGNKKQTKKLFGMMRQVVLEAAGADDK